jgi:DNA repair protein RecN (Recombination protein N)
MLVELKVTNFAIIGSLSLQFQPGLNILSGETGAGKSILLKSLALLMGDKSYAESVRSGAEFATIEGAFDLEDRSDVIDRLHELGIDTSDDQLVIRRLISPQGRSRVYLNGGLTALNSLREIVTPLLEVNGHYGAPLIEMTGQHDNRHLYSKSYHLDILDRFAGTWELRKEVQTKYDELKAMSQRLQQFKEDRLKRDERLSFLTFQRDELSQLNIEPGEEDELQSRFNRAKNSSRLADFCSQSEDSLYGDDESVLVRIHRILQRGQEICAVDEDLIKKLEPLQSAKTLIEEAVYEFREYGRSLEIEPGELQNLEERISHCRRLMKKYGGNVSHLMEKLTQIVSEINSLENFDESLANFEQKERELTVALTILAEDLHSKRVKASVPLSKQVNKELFDLNMKGVLFGVSVAQLSKPNPTGLSDVEFTTSSGANDGPRPLAKFASGGELSRILLALKRVVGLSDLPRTYLFDEVDAGVSGMTAEKVGRKLKSIAKGQQIICVTHLPQVAAFADHHFFIHKSPGKTKVEVEVKYLDKSDDRIGEIARLISGEKITKTSRDHARQLLQDSEAST